MKRFRERVIKIGLFETDQIYEINEPTKQTLERLITKIEETIEHWGDEHFLNTFVTVYYAGPAFMSDGRVEITLIEEKSAR